MKKFIALTIVLSLVLSMASVSYASDKSQPDGTKSIKEYEKWLNEKDGSSAELEKFN